MSAKSMPKNFFLIKSQNLLKKRKKDVLWYVRFFSVKITFFEKMSSDLQIM